MTIARRAISLTGALIGVSAVAALVRAHEEHLRRSGSAGTAVMSGPDGRSIEFLVGPGPEDGPTVVFESGLGSPLESWDWVARSLAPGLRTIRYHRRGYGRTRSRSSHHELVETLLRAAAPTGDVVIVAHSIGALVAANLLRNSSYVRLRSVAVLLIDGTDASLMRDSRDSRRARGEYLQMSVQEALASITGLNAWSLSKIERDVAYLPDVQRAYKVFSTSPRTLRAAYREFREEPISDEFVGLPVEVLSAADNTSQQRAFADRIGSSFFTVPGSAHRSIIGRPDCAEFVADRIRRAAA